MPVQAKRRTKGHGGMRRSHDSLKKVTLTKCEKCGKAVKPHTACEFCGSYRGKSVLKVEAKAKTKKKD